MKKRMKAKEGITLIALVVTVVVLLVLAGVSITVLFGDHGIFKTTEKATKEFQIAHAREKIEVTLGHAQILKHTDGKYNQNNYLNDLMKKEISNIKIKGDAAIVDNYAFNIDRSVPKIGEYLGKEEELIFPEVLISEPILEADYRTAKFTITAKEEKNGISKIEIWQQGQIIDTFEYSNVKTKIEKEYTAKRNGIYTVKVHSKLTNSDSKEVQGLVMAVEFSPNGNETYKKEHQVKIMVKEDVEKVKSLKYQWTKELTQPNENTFIKECTNNSVITGNEITGTYYLWILLETESNKKNLCCSEAFNFDNEGPQVKVNSNPETETSFTLETSATDKYSKIVKYEFFVDGKSVKEYNTNEESKSFTVEYGKMGEPECEVKVTDELGNVGTNLIKCRTQLHFWNKSNIKTKTVKEERVSIGLGPSYDRLHYITSSNVYFEQDTRAL